uniref:Uncharacterized protein n=2 Tax=Chaetoceros debilis TaxID=122233 RepID=A0A7S3V4K0_9STRA
MGKVWKAYAKFHQERSRFKTAQKIYLRALVSGDAGSPAAVTGAEDQDDLWNSFLDMMKASRNDKGLTLQQLKDAVQKEHKVSKAEPMDITSGNASASTVTAPMNVDLSMVQAGLAEITAQQPIPKRARIDDSKTAQPMVPLPIVTHSVLSATTVEASATGLLAIIKNMPPEITAEWLAMDGDACGARPEPPLFSPSPPKLGDASGKDLLGTEFALKVIRILIGNEESGSAILDICRACWIMTALKEREAAKSIEALDKKLANDIEKMELELEARLSVAGAALSAVEEMNKNEREQFISMCNQQRQQLQALISWEFRHVLVIQQQLLSNAGIPGFEGPTVDSTSIYIQSCVCSYLHSAFNVRRQIKEKPHLTMLKSQEARLASQQPVLMPLPPHLQGTSERIAPNYPPPPLPQHYPPQHSYQHGHFR